MNETPNETVTVTGTDPMMDAAALAKAALAQVSKKAEEKPVVAEAKTEPKVEPVATPAPTPAPAPVAEVKAEKVEEKKVEAPAEVKTEAKVEAPVAPETAAIVAAATEAIEAPAAKKGKKGKKAAKAEKPAKKTAKAAKATKPAKKASGKPERKSWGEKSVGQCGAAIENFTIERMNDHEKDVLVALGTEGHRKEMRLPDLAAAAFPTMKSAIKKNYTTRNALRRLVRGGLVTKEGRGTYLQTEEGRKQAKKV